MIILCQDSPAVSDQDMAKFSDLHTRVQRMMKETVAAPDGKIARVNDHDERKGTQDKNKNSRTAGSNSGNKKPSGMCVFEIIYQIATRNFEKHKR